MVNNSVDMQGFLKELDFELFLHKIEEELGKEGLEIVGFLSKGITQRKISKYMHKPYPYITNKVEEIRSIYTKFQED